MRASCLRLGLCTIGAVLLGTTASAFALDNDPALWRLCTQVGQDARYPCGDRPQADQAAFKKLSRDYGMALAPQLMAPAETLGINGFEFNLQYSVTNIAESESYWERGIDDQTPPSTLMTTRLDMRKGLPYSFEVGASTGWLVNSELMYFGGSLKWSPNEAVDVVPVDFAIRGSINRVVGSSELDLVIAGMDLSLGHSFGVGGIANISPYMAYSPVFIFAQSGVVDSSPGELGVQSDAERSFVFEEETDTIHRFVLGTRFVFGAVNLTPEAALAEGLQTYNVNLGLNF